MANGMRLVAAITSFLGMFACGSQPSAPSLSQANLATICDTIKGANGIPATFQSDQIRFLCSPGKIAELDAALYAGRGKPKMFAYQPKSGKLLRVDRSQLTWDEVPAHGSYHGTLRVVTGVILPGKNSIGQIARLYCEDYSRYRSTILAATPPANRAEVDALFKHISRNDTIHADTKKGTCRAHFLGKENGGVETEYVADGFVTRLHPQIEVGGNHLVFDYIDEHADGKQPVNKPARLGTGSPFVRDYGDLWIAVHKENQTYVYLFSKITFKSSFGISQFIEDGVTNNLAASMNGLVKGFWFVAGAGGPQQ